MSVEQVKVEGHNTFIYIISYLFDNPVVFKTFFTQKVFAWPRLNYEIDKLILNIKYIDMKVQCQREQNKLKNNHLPCLHIDIKH